MDAYSPTLRRLLAAALLLAGLLPLAACDPPSDETPAEEPELSEPLYFESIGRGERAVLADTTTVVFRDSAAWAAYQDSLRPVRPFAPVDFDQAMVVLAALPQSTSGYSVDVTAVEKTDTAIVASYVVNRPGTDCLTAAARTVPFTAVLVRRAEGPVHFLRTVEDYSCTGRQRY